VTYQTLNMWGLTVRGLIIHADQSALTNVGRS
jgi:hypothetical protein